MKSSLSEGDGLEPFYFVLNNHPMTWVGEKMRGQYLQAEWWACLEVGLQLMRSDGSCLCLQPFVVHSKSIIKMICAPPFDVSLGAYNWVVVELVVNMNVLLFSIEMDVGNGTIPEAMPYWYWCLVISSLFCWVTVHICLNPHQEGKKYIFVYPHVYINNQGIDFLTSQTSAH